MLLKNIVAQFAETQQIEIKKYLDFLGFLPGNPVQYNAYPSKLYKGLENIFHWVNYPNVAVDTILYQQKHLEQQYSVAVFLGILKNGCTRRKKENVIRVRAIFTECDIKEISKEKQIELLNKFKLKPSMLVWTGGKSVHAYWVPQDEYFTPEEFNQCQKGLISEYTRVGVDYSVKPDLSMNDITRCMRLPGTYHYASNEMATVIHTGERYAKQLLINTFGNDKGDEFDNIEEDGNDNEKSNSKVISISTKRGKQNKTKQITEDQLEKYIFSQNFWLLIQQSNFKLWALVSQTIKDRYFGMLNSDQVDASEVFTVLARELSGWQTLIQSLFVLGEYQLKIFDARVEWEELAFNWYGDQAKCDRVWDSIDFNDGLPAIAEYNDNPTYLLWIILKTVVNYAGNYLTREIGDQPLIEYITHYFFDIFGIPKIDAVYFRDKFYLYRQNHWQVCEDAYFLSTIQLFASKLLDVTINKHGVIDYKKPIRTHYAVKDCLAALKALLSLNADNDADFIPGRLPLALAHIPGLNLQNGVLTLVNGDGDRIPELVEHDSAYGFTSLSKIAWDPSACTMAAEDLLSCIPNDHHKGVFLGAIAASLDWKGYNAHIGRPKALIVIGEGANGKDSLKRSFGHILPAFGNFSLDLFNEQGSTNRTFGLFDLGRYQLSWVSENSSKINFSNLKTLIAAITGDQIKVEQKGKDHYVVNPRCSFIFHANRSFVLDGDDRMLKSRLYFIQMPNVYVAEPDPNVPHEKIANPRLHGDDVYQVNHVCPGLLVKLIEAYRAIWEVNQGNTDNSTFTPVGIDWHGTDQIFDRVVRTNNHLFEFMDDFGIVADASESSGLLLKFIYFLYNEWMVETGVAHYDAYSDRYMIDAQSQFNRFDRYLPNEKAFAVKFTSTFPKYLTERVTTKKAKGLTKVLGLRAEQSEKICQYKEMFDKKYLK